MKKGWFYIIFLMLLSYDLKAQVITLNFPVENSVLEETYVYFSWIPVSSSGNTVLYEFKLVEILNGQNKTSAIAYNTPLIEEQLYTSSHFVFTALEEGKRYAWSVQAYYNQITMQGEVPHTERINITSAGISQFEISEEIENEEELDEGYIVLLKDNSDPYIYMIRESQDTIRFKYTEEYDSTSVSVQIYEEATGEVLDSLADFSVDSLETSLLKEMLPSFHYLSGIHRGDNYIKLSRSLFTETPEPGRIYFLELKTFMGTIYRAKMEFE